jgi:NadR type nicotinamide-nucleotide adenylyltransferase
MPKLVKIAITGPESTGKSMLAQQLADHYATTWVPEFARVFLLNITRDYTFDDILEIAQKQKKSEKVFETLANKVLIADTELLVTKIWCDVKYKKCHQWIHDELRKQQYDLYLLMDVDLPWEYDPLREHPDKRKFLFDLYKKELENLRFNFKIVNGNGDERYKNALRFVEELVSNKVG